MTRWRINGVGLEASVGGRGPALLLLHGFTGTAATWSAQLPAWQRSFRTIAVDLVGHGRSESPTSQDHYGFEQQAADLATLLANADALPANVVGYSMGARIALGLAIWHPDAVAALVLESPSAGFSDPHERSSRRAADLALAGQIEREGVLAFVDHWEAQPIFASQASLPSDTRGRIRRERLSQQARGLAGALRGAGQGSMPPLETRFRTVRCPCLVIAGSLDSIGRERARAIADGISGARLEIVEDTGHAPHLERPHVVEQLVTAFLSTAHADQRHDLRH
jgi:2-succinyl-6-hydroxy-2,4-cyclohexadiene-1-carboxylate synthase